MVSGAAAPGEALLLVLDYPGLRLESRVEELGLGDRTGLRQVQLLRAPLPTATDPAGHLAELLARRPEGQCRAVLAYCASAPLADALAGHLAAAGPRPPVVVFDAEPVTTSTVLDAYRDTLTQLGARAAEPEAAELASLVDRPEQFIGAARRNLVAHVSDALRSDGCEPAEAGVLAVALTASCLDWLTHLLVARHVPRPEFPGPVLNIVSAGTPGGDVRVSCDRTSLLRDPRTREATLSFLAAHGALPTP
ncbi:hypothetical protein ABZ733_09855 [Streptomyces longwoodensis]|uniref:hypothetical protein n=1 Tax=Streptomyces longwoodensis TaxID=68231 RepID=UPI0033F9B5F3